MIDYHIQANTRRCATTGRTLGPGEAYFSVLLEEAGSFVRKDFAADVWSGPPSNSFSFWAGRIPPPDAHKTPRIDDDLLMDCFRRLEEQHEPSRIKFRYVVALLLLRQKRLRLETTKAGPTGDVMTFRCLRTRAVFKLIDPHLTDEEMETVQDEVLHVIGWD